MLGTAIVAVALTTGDTMSHTIRSAAVASLGDTDELVSAKGADVQLGTGLGAATGIDYFDESVVDTIDARLAGSDLVDGVTPAIIEQVAVQAPAQRQTEPRVTLFAADPARMEGFGAIDGTDGEVSLAELGSGEVFLNADAADELDVAPGDRILIFAGHQPARATVRDVVRYEGAGTTDAALLMPLADAQAFLGRPGEVRHVLISNRGGPTSGAGLTDQVVDRLEPTLAPLGLDVDPSKQDAIEAADVAGTTFMAFFTTFGSFSIAAGILLIFLVFVMLAAERRGELGIARAIGTRRGHLVETFTFEGAAYDLVAALVGALIGAGVAFLMVLVLAHAFSTVGGRSRDRVRRHAPQPGDRLRARRAPDAHGRRLLRLAGERDDDLDRDQEPARAGRSAPPPSARARPHRSRTGRPARDLGHGGRRRDAADPRRLARARQPRPHPARARCPRAGRVHGLRVGDRRLPASSLEHVGSGVRAALHELLHVDRRRPHDRRRRGLDDRLQRRRAARAGHGRPRTHPPSGAGAQDVHGLPAREPLPDRDDARHVHPRRLHARDRNDLQPLVPPRRVGSRHLRRRLRRAREHERRPRPSATSRRP